MTNPISLTGGNKKLMSITNNQYDENSIVTLDPREAVRQNLGMYIGDNDSRGMHHLLTEIVANAMDEAAAGFGKTITVKINTTNNMASVIDEGRGIPFRMNKDGKYAIVEMCTELHSGGKFEGAGNYKSSLGLHGLGASLVQSLSSFFSIDSVREDGTCSFVVIDGSYEDPEIVDGKQKKTGTVVEFIPDTKIFGPLKWDKKTIAEELQLHALLNNGLTFKLYFNNDPVVSYCYSNGIKDMIDIKRGDAKPITDVYYFKTILNQDQENEFNIEFAFQYIDKPSESIYAFTNGGYNPDFGEHVTGWKTAYTSYINTKARESGDLGEKDDNFSGDTVRKGLLLILSIKMNERPKFAEQTKLTRTSASARTACSQAVKKMELPKTILQQIIKKILLEKKAEDAAKRAKEAANKIAKGGKNMNALKDLPVKLADCTSRDGEIFFCEGDSAGGGAKETRDRQTQAVLPLRGKVLNTFDKELADIIHNQEIKDILTCLGCGIGENFNINNLRYQRIIFMADADADGGHITCLLTALFLRHLPEFVKAGKIYTAVPPLYRVQRKKETIYCYSDEELKAVAKKTDEVTRFKGLGEMSPAELYDTTMNPDKRHLIQLTTEDFDNTMDLYETLMGTSAKARRDFILANKLSKLDKDDVDLFDSEGDDE